MIEPMLAETGKPIDSQDWAFELKLDGVRCIAYLGSQTKLMARSGADISHKFPELSQMHRQAIKPCILDGEIVCATMRFEDIQQRIHKEKPLAIRLAVKQYPVIYFAFDILNGGESLIHKPLIDRKFKLANSFIGDCSARLLGWQNSDGIALFQRIRDTGLEGIMAKRLASTYQQGKRSRDWLKIKAFKETECFICGITQGENARANTFASLILGKEVNGELVYVGNAGSGFSEGMLKTLLQRFEVKDDCPFKDKPMLDRDLKFWTKPILKCEVRYFEQTKDGKLRFPSFRRMVG